MDKTEKRICWYSSIFIALLMSSPKLLALRESGLIAHYWHFNLVELLFQVAVNLGYCYVLFVLNLQRGRGLLLYREQGKYLKLLVFNALLMAFCCLVVGAIQRYSLMNTQSNAIYWTGHVTLFFLSSLLAAVMMKIILLMRESKKKDNENEQLKTAYLEAELELLKEQLNPHFLFNSLSSLSGIVRENPAKAQNFINHLSKIFRYALTQSGSHLVTVASELTMIQSYEQLLTMRFEKAFLLDVQVDKSYLERKIPHLSLQPLLENAAKHNSATIAKPLFVKIFVDDDKLVVRNNIQQIIEPGNSTGIGLVNLNSRFRIMMHREIEIEKTTDDFIVKLPLQV